MVSFYTVCLLSLSDTTFARFSILYKSSSTYALLTNYFKLLIFSIYVVCVAAVEFLSDDNFVVEDSVWYLLVCVTFVLYLIVFNYV